MAPPSPFRRGVTGRVSVVAHRGMSAEEPENTMRAFRAALLSGCDLIELDVQRTRDGVPVVMHDDTVDRTTGGRGAVRELTLEDVRKLEAGQGEAVPTLDEVCAWAATSGAVLSVELKQPTPVSGIARDDELATSALAALGAHALLERCLVHSFDHPTIAQVRRLEPRVATGVLYGGGTLLDPLALGRSADAHGIHPWWTSVSAELCAAAHREGMHVHGWGMSHPPREDEVRLLVAAGVDSIDANDPRALRAILERIEVR